MIGSIIGDIVGSPYENVNCKRKDFSLFSSWCRFTDDTLMTLAVAQALLQGYNNLDELSKNAIACMQNLGREYPYCGFGSAFKEWLKSDNPQPYNSFGNGAAMRVSSVGFIAKDIEEAKAISKAVTQISHNHLEAIKGAEAVAVAIVLAKQGSDKREIKDYICKNYYEINFTLNEIRPTYKFDVSCQGSVPQAFEAFFESTDFEDTIRNAVSIGGDSDTIAAIAGGIAEAYYGVPKHLEQFALRFLDDRLLRIYRECISLNKVV